MCTGMNVKTEYGDIFFGRTMDFSHELDPQMYVVSRGYEWSNILNTHTIVTQYAFMGIGQDISPVTLESCLHCYRYQGRFRGPFWAFRIISG